MLARRHRKMVTLRKVWTVTIIVAIIRAENFNEPILRKMGGRYVVVVKKMKNVGGVRGFYASLEADIFGRISMVHPPNAELQEIWEDGLRETFCKVESCKASGLEGSTFSIPGNAR
jgi:hypothetical protein